MKRKISVTPSALVSEIATRLKATPANLKERWLALYGTEPPRRIRRDLLTRALAYRLQEQALGGLTAVHPPIADEGRGRCLCAPADPGDARAQSQARNGTAARVARYPTSGDRP